MCIAILMIIDVILYSYINGMQDRLLVFAEYFIIFFFILTFICIKYVNFSKSEEDL